jgi:glyoxylase I family protein
MVPFKLKQIDHIVLRIRDLEASRHFYCDVLGCTMDKVQDAIGLWQVRAGSSLIDLIPLDGALGSVGGAGPGREGRNVDHFALQLDSFDGQETAEFLDAIRAHLAAHNVSITDSGRRYGAQGDGPSIYILDPDGNSVELKGPPD